MAAQTETLTIATLEANADGVGVSAEVRKEGRRYMIVVDGQRVDSTTELRAAYQVIASAVRQRLPRGSPRSWGVVIRCNTTGFTLAYGNRSGGSNGRHRGAEPVRPGGDRPLPREHAPPRPRARLPDPRAVLPLSVRRRARGERGRNDPYDRRRAVDLRQFGHARLRGHPRRRPPGGRGPAHTAADGGTRRGSA